MIHKMHALYKHIDQEHIDALNDPYGLAVGSKENTKVLSLDFSYENEVFTVQGFTLADYDAKKNQSDYFYRNAPGTSSSPFLALYISDEGMKYESSYSLKSKDYKTILLILQRNAEINSLLQGLYDYFMQNHDTVIPDIAEYLPRSKDETCIFTIRVNGNYIGKSPLFETIRSKIAQELYSDYYHLGNKKIVGQNMNCSLCLQHKDELWGYVSTYNFYTSKTELAPIAGGLKKELAHINYPVCPECAAELKMMRPIADKYFRFRFCGFNYLLIPEAVVTDTEDALIKRIIEIMVEQYDSDANELLNLQTRLGELKLGKRKKLIDDYSKEIFDYLAQTQNNASYNMLFYEAQQQQFKLLLSIEDIFPSQFAAIYEAKEKAENHDVFKNLPGKKQSTYDLEFRFDLIKEFFPIKSKLEGDFSKAFLELTRNIFMQNKISYNFVLQRIVNVVSKRFTNDENYELATRKAFLLLKFLSYLGISDNTINDYKEEPMTPVYAEFFEEHADFFDNSAKKYVFLTGVHAQKLINIQLQDRGAAPFRKRLNSLKLDANLVHRIFTEAREKLIQYDKPYYQKLEEEIATLMVKGDINYLSKDEISFIFTLGMTLSRKFTEQKSDDNQE